MTVSTDPLPIALTETFFICIVCWSPNDWIDVAPDVWLCDGCGTTHLMPEVDEL
jgi:hypothetical protein